MNPQKGFYVYNSLLYLTALSAYASRDYRHFDRLEDARAHVATLDGPGAPHMAIDRITVRPA